MNENEINWQQNKSGKGEFKRYLNSVTGMAWNIWQFDEEDY